MKSFILGPVIIVLTVYCSAQQPASAPSGADPQARIRGKAGPAPSKQAPDDATKKITELVHAGKYTEAEQLTTGLLLAYPNDQRLIKAKALIQKLLAPDGSGTATQANKQPAAPVMNANSAPLIGVNKVEYNSLIELARQAQQTTDLAEQTKLLKQFMGQSDLFLQKHADQMLLWQLRAASAISLNDPTAGYEAGSRLISSGSADSNDANLQRLLAQLNNRGWLEKQNAQEAERNWILGTWSVSVSHSWPAGHDKKFKTSWDEGSATWSIGSVEFSRSASVIEGRYISADGTRTAEPHYRGTVLDSGEMRWENQDYLYPTGLGWQTNPNVWTQATSFAPGKDKRTMKIVFPTRMTTIDGDTLIFTKK